MMRRSRPLRFLTRAPRALMALTGLVTIWCLGCSGFEPLLDAFVDSSAQPSMACSETETGSDETPTIGAVPVSSTSGSVVCGCQFCGAVSLPVLAMFTAALPIPSTLDDQPVALLSVEREPVVPPPQRSLPRA